ASPAPHAAAARPAARRVGTGAAAGPAVGRGVSPPGGPPGRAADGAMPGRRWVRKPVSRTELVGGVMGLIFRVPEPTWRVTELARRVTEPARRVTRLIGSVRKPCPPVTRFFPGDRRPWGFARFYRARPTNPFAGWPPSSLPGGMPMDVSLCSSVQPP